MARDLERTPIPTDRSIARADSPRAERSEAWTGSPLSFVTQEPTVNGLIHELQGYGQRLMAAPDDEHVLRFSLTRIAEVRHRFASLILRGEHKLHRLCELLCGSLLGDRYVLRSVVVGEIPESGERFTLEQTLGPEELYGQTDFDLGNRLLSRLQFQHGDGWQRPELVANVVEYEATEETLYGVHKLISRIKAEEEIWNKVVDEIFDLDALVRRDKQLRHLSRYVKDVFGIKIVAADPDKVRALDRFLRSVSWTPEQLATLGIPQERELCGLELVESKDYLETTARKSSGWQAIKIVVRWWEMPCEIQLQPLHNYLRERERLTAESHEAFRSHRERLRDEVARGLPLFGFYRDLLRWLFVDPEGEPPRFRRVRVEVEP